MDYDVFDPSVHCVWCEATAPNDDAACDAGWHADIGHCMHGTDPDGPDADCDHFCDGVGPICPAHNDMITHTDDGCYFVFDIWQEVLELELEWIVSHSLCLGLVQGGPLSDFENGPDYANA